MIPRVAFQRRCRLGLGGRLAIVALVLLVGRTPAFAQPALHSVRLAPSPRTGGEAAEQRWYPRPVITESGSVTQFDANQISIQTGAGAVARRYASARVIDIEFADVPDDQREALDAFRNGDFATALPALVRAVSGPDAQNRPPVWRQQWLSMVAASAATRSGRGEIALELIEQLDRRPLPAMVLGVLPIDWTGRWGKERGLVSVAAKRASSDSLAVKLVAASWLLRSPDYRAAAESALDRLASQSQRPHLAALAAQLIWRTKSPPEVTQGIGDWERQIDGLPMSLQTGPMVALRDQARRLGLTDVAKQWELTLQHTPPSWHPDL